MSKLSDTWHTFADWLVLTYKVDPALAKLIHKYGLWIVGGLLALLGLLVLGWML